LVINSKTAKALSLTAPQMYLCHRQCAVALRMTVVYDEHQTGHAVLMVRDLASAYRPHAHALNVCEPVSE
jgi:hypothetical protein